MQILPTKEKTTGQYGTIRSIDLALFSVINADNLRDQDKNILTKLFEKISKVELDKITFKLLGINDSEISKWLLLLYEFIVEE